MRRIGERRVGPRRSRAPAIARVGLLAAGFLAILTGAPRAEEPTAAPEAQQFKFVKLIGKLHEEKMLWQVNWKAGSMERTEAAKIALAVATAEGLSRKELADELGKAGEQYKRVTRNLDIGRHQLVKELFAQAVARANGVLRDRNMMPLEKVTTVNSGGTGDFTRDIDLSVFAGDDARETVFFEALRDLAIENGLKILEDPKLGVKAGLNIPQLDLAFHRGVNDVPDARYASDVKKFALDYRTAIEKQARNPEAYFGYGFEMEVQGRRSLSFKPGQTLVQEFDWDGQGVKYTGQIATYQREVRAILRGAIGQRYRRAQQSVYITNNYLEAFRHEQGTDHDPSKGALKYAGRSVEQFCEYHGFKPWPDLILEDRIQLLARLWPPGYLDEPGARIRLEKLATALDVAYLTFNGKKVPEVLNRLASTVDTADAKKVADLKAKTDAKNKGKTPPPEPKNVAHPSGPPTLPPIEVDAVMTQTSADLALFFMQRAAAATASSVAKEMLDPPHLSERFLAEVNRTDSRWNSMNAAEREAYARQRDENYRACISVAAMENLLAQVEQLMILDMPEFNKRGTLPGTMSALQLLQMAEPSVRPLIEIAMEHAAAAAMLNRATTPEMRTQAIQRMNEARAKLEAKLVKAPGSTVIADAAKINPIQFVRDRVLGKPGPWSQAAEETAARLKKHVEESFPPRDFEAFKRNMQDDRIGGYLGHRMKEEFCQLGNAVDILKLIEMYQDEKTTRADVKVYLTTSFLSRCYWGLGFMIQAAQVRTEKDLDELGKNIVFDAFQRVIPGVGTFKVLFDIEKGIVVVTVGYAINEVNAELIDAIYTGEAGRTRQGSEGTVEGAIRESTFCVVPAKYVLKAQDAKLKTLVSIDQPGLYRHFFQQWIATPAGVELRYDDVYSRPVVNGPPGKYLQAHDRLVQLMQDAYNQNDPGWFGEKSTGYKFSDKDLDAAMRLFSEFVRRQAGKEVGTVLAALAPRQYFKDGEDVIAAGLETRLANDVMTGFLDTWKTHRTEQMFARRQVEYMARLADLGALAKGIFDAPLGGWPAPTYKLEVKVGAPGPDGVYDGSEPLPITCVLHCTQPVQPDASDVVIEIKDEPFVLPAGESRIKPGLVVTQKLVVRAIGGGGSGPVLDEVPLTLKVRLPDDLITQLKGARRVSMTYEGPTTYTEDQNAAKVLSGHIAVGADPLSFAGKLGGIQATWSGNSFTIDIDQATDTTTNGEHSTGRLRGHLMGTLNVAKKTLTMSGEITEDTRLENGNLGSDTLQTWKNVSHLSAADIPLITATGGGADPQDIKFRIEGQKNIVSHRVAGDASSKHTRDFKGGTRSDQTATGLAPETPGMQTPSVEIIFSKTSYQDFINHVLNKP